MLPRLWGLLKQVCIIFVLEKVYEMTRGIVPQQARIALQHGLDVVNIEKSWRIFDEWRLQSVVLTPTAWSFGPVTVTQHELVGAINHFYLYSHFLGTLLFLIWLYLFRRRYFPYVRDVLIVTSALAMVIYVVFPMMPPRLMGSHMHVPDGYHFKDTIAPLINYKLQQTQLGYNPYAAMPSLHFAWALILGVTLIVVGRNWILRIVGLLYPFMMLATILVTGNHLLLDAAGSVIVVTVSALIASAWHRHRALRRQERELRLVA